MPKSMLLGEFEHLVLLAIVRLGPGAYASAVREELRTSVGHTGTRGALYRTLDRLEHKGYVTWETQPGGPERGGMPSRRFAVTPAGLEALRTCREVFERLWSGLDTVFGRGVG